MITDALEAQRRLISVGICGGAQTVISIAANAVTAEMFPDAKLREIFVAQQAIAGRCENVTVEAIYRELGGFAATYDLQVLAGLDGLEPTSMRARQLCEDVKSLHRQRKLVSSLGSALEAASSTANNWADLWEVVAPHLQNAQDAGLDAQHRSLADMAEQAARWRTEPDSRATLATPWPAIDRAFGKPRGGELIVIAGRPGAGKTTCAGNIISEAAQRGENTGVFSMEMTGEENIDRFAVREAGAQVAGGDQRSNAIIAEHIRLLGKLKTLHIYEAGDAHSIAQIEAMCRLLAASPLGLQAVVIDYLQLVTPPAETRRDNRERQVSEMSRRFKLLAQSLNCPVFLLCQLNRESEKEERRPRLSDLRESGSIEQDADRVWFLYRPKPPAHQAPQQEDAAMIDVSLYQAKCRNGPAGIEAALRFNRPCFDFTT